MNLAKRIKVLYEKNSDFVDEDYQLFLEFRKQLEQGLIRAAEKIDGVWKTNIWVKKGILLGFRLGVLTEMSWSDRKVFWDKNTYPERTISEKEGIRIVPGGSSIRSGAYLGKNITIMPPSYINTGAYIDDGTMLDSHSLVGSCAQVGKRVHLSAGAMIGGVL